MDVYDDDALNGVDFVREDFAALGTKALDSNSLDSLHTRPPGAKISAQVCLFGLKFFTHLPDIRKASK
jgi:hypothetical protein